MTDVGDFLADMRCSGRPGDRTIASLATSQHGVVGYRQLLELGFGKGAIQRRVSAGRLHRLHQGVFAVGHQALRPQGTLMAAALAGGPGAVISHRSAAAMWELLPTSGSRVDVTAPGGRRPGRLGIALHRGRLHTDDRARRAAFR